MENKINSVTRKVVEYIQFENFIRNNKNNIVFLCVGNSEVWYDSFGPIVGDLLVKKYNIDGFVYGGMRHNIKQSNLNDYIEWVQQKHKLSKIVVIDAAVSKKSDEVVFRRGATKCAYYSESSKEIGDYSVLCPIANFSEIEIGYKDIVSKALTISTIIANIYL